MSAFAAGAGDDGFPSGVAAPDADADADGRADAVAVGADDADGADGADGFPPPVPTAWAVQPVAASATATVARTALLLTERFMVAPRGTNCAHRDASRPPSVAHPRRRAAML
ncbi:hypothetical protein ACI2LJ_23585 [Streptomyces sp. NPDC088090]|uniref:hypothetical protein n=1 Tax=Streptomyces sp. NPDC088090 TaxID=3365822 RepID=UPI00384C42A1